MTANGVGEREGLDRNLIRRVRAARQHADIGFDDSLQPDAARSHYGRIIVVGSLPSGRHHDRDCGFEFMDCVGVAPGAGVTNS